MNKPYKIITSTLFIIIVFILSSFIIVSDISARTVFDNCPSSGGVNECTGQNEKFCGECVTGISDNRIEEWTLDCFSCAWSCPPDDGNGTELVVCGNICGPVAPENPTCIARGVTTDDCGDCTTTCINAGDTYCILAEECRTPSCDPGDTWNGCDCVENPYILASPDNYQDASIKIFDDIFMANEKAIRVDGAGDTTLEFRNEGSGSFQMDIYGILKTTTTNAHILSNALYGTAGIAEDIWLGDLNDSIQIQGELCFDDGFCDSNWDGPSGTSLWEENGNDIINSNSDSVNVNVGGDDVTNSYNFYVEGTTGLGGDTTIFSNLYFPMAQDHSIKINNSNTGDGGSLTIEAGDAGASSVGGNIYLNPGSGDINGDVIIGGNVGIGNEDPDVKLVVGNGSDPLGNIIHVNNASPFVGYKINNPLNEWSIGMDNAGNLILGKTDSGSVRLHGNLLFDYADGSDKVINLIATSPTNGHDLFIYAGNGTSVGKSGGNLYLSGGNGDGGPDGDVIFDGEGIGIGDGLGGALLGIDGTLRSESANFDGATIGGDASSYLRVSSNNVYIHAEDATGGNEDGGDVYIDSGEGNSRGDIGNVFLAQSRDNISLGDVGIGTGVNDPSAKLDVNGGIKIGNSGVEQRGVIRYSGGDFWGNVPVLVFIDPDWVTINTWKSLTLPGTIVYPPLPSQTIFVEFSGGGSGLCTPVGGDSQGVTCVYSELGNSTLTCNSPYPRVVSGGGECYASRMTFSGPLNSGTWGVGCGKGAFGEPRGAGSMSIVCSQ